MTTREDIIQRLRAAPEQLRRKSMPLADFIPLLQEAADAIAAHEREKAGAQQKTWLMEKAEEAGFVTLEGYFHSLKQKAAGAQAMHESQKLMRGDRRQHADGTWWVCTDPNIGRWVSNGEDGQALAPAGAQALREAAEKWIPVTEQMPKSGQTVLALQKWDHSGRPSIIRAAWVAAKAEESSPESDIGEYDEATDTYYDPEGWYEQISHWDEISAAGVSGATITHWMPLPAIDAALRGQGENG